MKKTLVLGATTNPERYAFRAAHSLTAAGHSIIPVGIRTGEVAGEEIVTDKRIFPDVDTVTLYVGPSRQHEWYDYVLQTNPKRVIFNPGTENPELMLLLREKGIDYEEACTLVMLAAQTY